MITFRKIMVSFACVLLMAIAGRSESWRGIVPLHSTKSDVERLLGQPSEATDKLLTYRFENETVFISLITEATPGIKPKSLRPGIVRDIQVMPKHVMHVADLGVDEKRVIFIKGSKPEYSGFFGYVDEEAGLIVKTGGPGVEVIFYFANAKDRAKCPSCRVDVQQIADMPICILCPTVSVSSEDEIVVGDKTIFTTRVTIGYPPPRLTFTWTVDQGKIVAGQGTPTIAVDTSNVKGETITATVDVGGIDPACSRTASSSTKVTKRRNEPPHN